MRIVCEKGDGFWLGIFAVYDGDQPPRSGDQPRYRAYADPPPQPLYDRLYISVCGRTINDAFFIKTLLRWAIEKIEAAIRDGNPPGVPVPNSDPVFRLLNFDDDSAQELAVLADSKSCDYRTTRAGASFCTVAAPQYDITARGTEAPTTQLLCMRCDLPAGEFICSHLHHPAIEASVPPEGVLASLRRLKDAHCDVGNDKRGNGSLCRPFGNDCWGEWCTQS